ncbi:MAG: NERD domain-containing protein [Candidatus Lokiarchaeota archaeon]|nr:NERD domain-containing protein [Candidatus Lokiarchaeota archaeon]
MSDLFSTPSLRQFFLEIYNLLKEGESEVIELWFEISDIEFLTNFSDLELREFLERFDFISIQKGNYINYVVINKIIFITRCIQFLELDVSRLSNLLNYDGFEALIQEILSQNNYRTIKNFRFSDKSNLKYETSQKRYEIDVIGIYQSFILIIDAKQWKRKDSYSAMNKAANLQYQRVVALKKNPETISDLVQSLLGMRYNVRKKLPFTLIPIMVTLETNWIKINDNSVPLVGIYNLNSFLHELQINLQYFKTVKVSKIIAQKQLF